jgi:hypothetical protein
VLDDWQESLLFASLRQRQDGSWAAFEVAGVVPRQNGKGAIMEARQLVGLFVLGESLQVHTAHEFKTCVEHFLRVKSLVEASDELWEQVRIVRTGAGDQAIELRTGERLRFLARSRSSGRGFSADVVYFDEAFELPIATVGAVLPTLSARPNPQVWYFSSSPHFTSEFLHSLLRRADDGGDERLLLRAWENDLDVQVDDEEAWRRVNPALGIRIDEEFIRGEMRTLTSTPAGVVEYQRERLGIRQGADGETGVVPYETWADLIDPDSVLSPSGVSYGLASAPDGSAAAVGSSGRRSDGLLHVDTVKWAHGTDWVVPYVIDLHSRKRRPIRVNPAGAEGAFIRPLVEAGVEVVEVDGRGYQAACGEFLDAVKNRQLRHLGQRTLDTSVSVAGRRDVGKEGGWVWVRVGETDITPLVAATVALSGVTQRRVPTIW